VSSADECAAEMKPSKTAAVRMYGASSYVQLSLGEDVVRMHRGVVVFHIQRQEQWSKLQPTGVVTGWLEFQLKSLLSKEKQKAHGPWWCLVWQENECMELYDSSIMVLRIQPVYVTHYL
jgi:hypothetical protein